MTVMKKERKKKPRNKPLLEANIQDSATDSKLLRALGSPDRDTRERGLALLTKWLQSHEDVSDYDILRLWKGLYFCFWHSDLISVQVRVCHACLVLSRAGRLLSYSPVETRS
jgi:hypothetical protein